MSYRALILFLFVSLLATPVMADTVTKLNSTTVKIVEREVTVHKLTLKQIREKLAVVNEQITQATAEVDRLKAERQQIKQWLDAAIVEVKK